jgi:hypothetical protein
MAMTVNNNADTGLGREVLMHAFFPKSVVTQMWAESALHMWMWATIGDVPALMHQNLAAQ